MVLPGRRLSDILCSMKGLLEPIICSVFGPRVTSLEIFFEEVSGGNFDVGIGLGKLVLAGIGGY